MRHWPHPDNLIVGQLNALACGEGDLAGQWPMPPRTSSFGWPQVLFNLIPPTRSWSEICLMPADTAAVKLGKIFASLPNAFEQPSLESHGRSFSKGGCEISSVASTAVLDCSEDVPN